MSWSITITLSYHCSVLFLLSLTSDSPQSLFPVCFWHVCILVPLTQTETHSLTRTVPAASVSTAILLEHFWWFSGNFSPHCQSMALQSSRNGMLVFPSNKMRMCATFPPPQGFSSPVDLDMAPLCPSAPLSSSLWNDAGSCRLHCWSGWSPFGVLPARLRLRWLSTSLGQAVQPEVWSLS
jgi:hypothetical protein